MRPTWLDWCKAAARRYGRLLLLAAALLLCRHCHYSHFF